MNSKVPRLEWCVVSNDKDGNWWVKEISDEKHWDTSELGIIDPNQAAYVIDLALQLCDYGFDIRLMESCFFVFKIEADAGERRIRLRRTHESVLDTDEKLFLLPDIMDEEKGRYSDFLEEIMKCRVKLLNDMIRAKQLSEMTEFKAHFTKEEFEEVIRESNHSDGIDHHRIHFFQEIATILEYVPKGYDLEGDEDQKRSVEEEIPEGIPDIDDDEIEEDETMRWNDDEFEGEFDDEEDEDDLEDESNEEDDKDDF